MFLHQRQAFDKPTRHPTREIRTVSSKQGPTVLRSTRCCCLKFQPRTARHGINDGSTFLSVAVTSFSRYSSKEMSATSEEIFDRETWGTVMRCSRKSLNETSKQQDTIFLSHGVAYFCSFFSSSSCSSARGGERACGSIAFIKARCHGIVTAVRLISVLAARRCQPHRSRTLAARRVSPPS